MTYEAQATFRQYKILVVKENAHSSQINQAFDQDPAKKGKQELRYWLPQVRDRPGLVKQVDQWSLLAVIMAGQQGGRGSAWTSGFKRVNLHPQHRLPIEVWLSKISDALVAAGGTELSNDSPYGEQHLRLIRVPAFYADLDDVKKMEMKTKVTDPSFDWSKEKIDSLPEWCVCLLRKSSNLLDLYKFTQHMQTCVQNGVALSTDLTPSEALSRLRLSSSHVPKPTGTQKDQNRDNMANVGLGSYQMFGGLKFNSCCLGKPADEKICQACFDQRTKKGGLLDKACQYRSRFAGNTPSSHLLLCHSSDQERTVFNLNARDLSIGSFLDCALDVNVGKGLASRKLNMLGLIDGVAEIVNSEDGLRRRRQAAQFAESLESMKLSKREHKLHQKQKKQGKAATRQTRVLQEAHRGASDRS